MEDWSCYIVTGDIQRVWFVSIAAVGLENTHTSNYKYNNGITKIKRVLGKSKIWLNSNKLCFHCKMSKAFFLYSSVIKKLCMLEFYFNSRECFCSNSSEKVKEQEPQRSSMLCVMGSKKFLIPKKRSSKMLYLLKASKLRLCWRSSNCFLCIEGFQKQFLCIWDKNKHKSNFFFL